MEKPTLRYRGHDCCNTRFDGPDTALAADKPNIILMVSDDFGCGDAGAYGGGQGRVMPSLHTGPRSHPDRRIPKRNGMTNVAFQGPGGLPKAEWTLASVLKRAGYRLSALASDIWAKPIMRYPSLRAATR
jgi:hypothetical protein